MAVPDHSSRAMLDLPVLVPQAPEAPPIPFVARLPRLVEGGEVEDVDVRLPGPPDRVEEVQERVPGRGLGAPEGGPRAGPAGLADHDLLALAHLHGTRVHLLHVAQRMLQAAVLPEGIAVHEEDVAGVDETWAAGEE